MRRWLIAPMFVLLGSTAPAPAPFDIASLGHWCGDPVQAGARPAILPGYGGGGFDIRTGDPQAQAYFTNGMQLAHAFAHKAAIAAFAEARRIDPDCAMCAWGEAWSSGPTINYGIDKDAIARLAAMTATAEALARDAPVRERNLIGALKQRYLGDAKTGNRAFADAMEKLVALYPADDEIAVIAADALMIAAGDLSAGSAEGAAAMARPVALLEAVLARNPDYTPAIHFYIHSTEVAGYPARAERFADQLPRLAPAASHLIHMPSHTYYWVGRYEDAATANVRAVAIGEDNSKRLGLPEPDGVWTLTYHPHNVHYGIGGALMSGDFAAALALARPMVPMAARVGKLDPFRQFVLGEAYVAIARFAPDEMLGVADPGRDNPIAQGIWHYARGEAHAQRGDAAAVRREQAAMPRTLRVETFGMGTPFFTVARHVLEGRVAMLHGNPARAARAYAKAAAIEEAKPLTDFSDPPLWWYPVRRDLAAALLAAGDAKGALEAADISLKRRTKDPEALAIRARAQAALGNAQAAAIDRAAARRGWHGDPDAIG